MIGQWEMFPLQYYASHVWEDINKQETLVLNIFSHDVQAIRLLFITVKHSLL